MMCPGKLERNGCTGLFLLLTRDVNEKAMAWGAEGLLFIETSNRGSRPLRGTKVRVHESNISALIFWGLPKSRTRLVSQ